MVSLTNRSKIKNGRSLHLVHKLCAMAVVDVGLLEPDSHGQERLTVHLFTLHPLLERCRALLMHDMSGRGSKSQR